MADLSALVDRAVRLERGRIVGRLVRLGESLDEAEEAFQEAALAAVAAWRERAPESPGAWLMTAAKNSARDARRHRAVASAKAPLLVEDDMDAQDTVETICDDHLRLIFTCCHPSLSLDSRVAVTLKVVAGFSTEEIARTFVCSEDTVSQRILRAKQTIAEKKLSYAPPEGDALGSRVSAVLGVVYALFNEGHTATSGELMRLDLQAEALRLARLLCDLLPREPEAFGLLALIAFGAARAKTRLDADGLPILLSAQDRSAWSKELLREGLMALARARSLAGGGPFALQAEIAAVHVTAPTWGLTDWPAVVALYEALASVVPSPVVGLNRAIAVSMRDGPSAGLAALKPLERALHGYHLFYAARAELLERAGKDPSRDLRKALSLATNAGERRLLEQRLRACQPDASGAIGAASGHARGRRSRPGRARR